MATPEANNMREVMLAVGSEPATRVFRNNTGTGWTGETSRAGGRLTITNPRPLNAGLCKGSADLIGWHSVTITPDMVGRTVAVFTALEVKAGRGKLTEEQANFLRTVREAGGIARMVHNGGDARQALHEYRSEGTTR